MPKQIFIDLSRQLLYAFSGKRLIYRMDCLSGDNQHPTTPGNHRITRKHKIYRSRQYDTQMNYAMFFHRGEAIHEAFAVLPLSYMRSILNLTGNSEINPWGSHGCIRLDPDAAKLLFSWTPIGTQVTVSPKDPKMPGPYLDGLFWRDPDGNLVEEPESV